MARNPKHHRNQGTDIYGDHTSNPFRSIYSQSYGEMTQD